MAQMATEAVAQTVPLEGVVIVLPAGPHRVIRLADGNLCAVPEHLSPEEEQVVARQKSSDLYKYRQEAAEQEVIDISSCNVRVVAAPQESCEEQQDCVQEQLVDLDTSKQVAPIQCQDPVTLSGDVCTTPDQLSAAEHQAFAPRVQNELRKYAFGGN